jgi:class 3 adenylate cyclase
VDDTPLSNWVAGAADTVAVVFSDVVESTALLHRAGTVNYAQILAAHRQHAARLISRGDGRLIGHAGDELLAAFRTTAEAYRFGRALFDNPGHDELSVRVGMHVGTVQVHGPDLLGRTIHFGARVMSQARGRELWLSDAAKHALEAEAPELAAEIRWAGTARRRLKGIPRLQRLWRVDPLAD